MKIIENGKIREMTAEEVKAYEQEQEFLKSLTPETARDYIEDFLDELAEVKSLTDIIKIAKDIKRKRGK